MGCHVSSCFACRGGMSDRRVRYTAGPKRVPVSRVSRACARRRTHIRSCWLRIACPSPSLLPLSVMWRHLRHARMPPPEEAWREEVRGDGRETGGSVMKCHAMSWRRTAGPCSPPPSRSTGGGAAPESSTQAAARASAAGGDRLRSCVPPSRQRAVSLFRASSRGRARGAAGGRIAAARLARLIARARRRTHLARRFPPGLFRGPQPSLSAEKPKGGPGSRLSLLSFYTIPPNVKPVREHKVKLSDIFHEMPAETRSGSTLSVRPSLVMPGTSPLLSGLAIGQSRAGVLDARNVSCPLAFHRA